MAQFKVRTVWVERYVETCNIEAKDAEEAEALALERVQEQGYPETDDVMTLSVDFDVEEVE